ncbi:MAG: hypothetical protein OXC92_00930 [Flavobacteriaceae bacterium]|nr:hypothetical protein [Flavobacteriaceae bacterium]
MSNRLIERTAKRIIATDKYRFRVGKCLDELRETLIELEDKIEELETQYNIQLPIKHRVRNNYNDLDGAIGLFIEQNHKALRDFVEQKPRRK